MKLITMMELEANRTISETMMSIATNIAYLYYMILSWEIPSGWQKATGQYQSLRLIYENQHDHDTLDSGCSVSYLKVSHLDNFV